MATRGVEFWNLEAYEFEGQPSNAIISCEMKIDQEGNATIQKFISNDNYYDNINGVEYEVAYNKVFKIPKKQYAGTLDSVEIYFSTENFSKKEGIIHYYGIPYHVKTALGYPTKYKNEKLKDEKWVFMTEPTKEGGFTEKFTFKKVK